MEQRNLFNAITGWYPEPGEEDKYHLVDKQALLSVMARNYIMNFAVEGGNFNVFSYVCRIKVLASKVGKSCIQLRTIIRLTFSIIVRGVNLESDQLKAVHVYRH